MNFTEFAQTCHRNGVQLGYIIESYHELMVYLTEKEKETVIEKGVFITMEESNNPGNYTFRFVFNYDMDPKGPITYIDISKYLEKFMH